MTGRIERVICISVCLCILPFVASDKVAAGLDATPLSGEAPGTLVWIGKHRLHLHCTGTGSPTVVFDSGLGGSSLDWVLVQPEVAKFTRACSYDRAGYGWSDAGPRPRDSARLSRELATLLGNASVPAPYLLVGHSFGGFNVQLYGHNNPQRIAGMLLIDSSHEDQFARFEAAGVTSTAPRNHSFVLHNSFQVPAAMPPHAAAVAESFATRLNNVLAIRSELAHFRDSASQLRNATATLDIPVVVVSHRVDVSTGAGPAMPRETVWMEMQRDLVHRASNGKHVIAATDEHHVHLSQPRLIVDEIRNLVEQSD